MLRLAIAALIRILNVSADFEKTMSPEADARSPSGQYGCRVVWSIQLASLLAQKKTRPGVTIDGDTGPADVGTDVTVTASG